MTVSSATQHAEAILRAWVLGDWRKLDNELDEVAALPCEWVSGFEEERVELLKALAVQLKSNGPWQATQTNDVRLDLCAKLLRDLIVKQQPAFAFQAVQ